MSDISTSQSGRLYYYPQASSLLYRAFYAIRTYAWFLIASMTFIVISHGIQASPGTDVNSGFTSSPVGSATAVATMSLGTNSPNSPPFEASFATCPTITFTAPAANTQYCGNGTATFTVSTTAVAPDGIKLVAFTTETNPYSTTATPVFSTSTASSTATGTKTLTFSNVQLPDNLTGANMGLFVYAILATADASCQPVDDLIITLKPRPNTIIGGPTQVCTGDKATLSALAFSGATYQWFYGSGTTSISTSNPYTTTAINTAATYRVRVTLSSCVSDDASFTVTPVTCTSCTASATSLGGKVFHDFDSDGTADTYDVSLSNVTVTLFRCDATNQSAQVAQMQTDLNGAYSFTGLTAGTTYRVEFSNLPAGYQPTYRGTNNGTTVQFTQPGSCTTSLGLNTANDYCQTNPLLVTPCYLDGAVTPNTVAGTDVLVGINYDLTGSVNHIATRTQIGSTWGVAYAKTTKQLYTAAFLKRHVGLKDGNLGQIYVTDMTNPASPVTTPWLNVSALAGVSGNWQFDLDAARGLTNAGTPSLDAQSFSVVAGIGLGDIDVSEDDKTLYVMDLTNKQLLSIDIASKTLIGKYPVPSLCTTGPSTSYFSAGSGNNTFIAADGKEWQKGYLFDIYGSSINYGQTITNPNNATAGTADAALYANSAYVNAGSTMIYSFPVGNGTFGVKLHFATNATTNNRNMSVALESTTVLSGFDVYAAAGSQINVGITRSFTTTVTDGVLTIAITGNTGGGAAMLSGFELTTSSGTPTGETRPFGLAVHNGKVYVGAICDASHSQNRDDLQASVLVFDPTTSTYNPIPVLTFPLNYTKGLNVSATPTDVQQWHPWTSIYPNTTGINVGGFTLYTQPTLSDIEFDVDGSMILGFFDRFQHQQGAVPGQYTPDHIAANGRTSAYGAVGGDLLRAYFNGTSYEVEYNGKEGPTSPKTATSGQNSGQGIGGGEFYVDDTGLHQEISTGGLAFKPGSGEIRISAGDPLVYSSGGLTGFDNTTGAKQNGFTLYSGTGGGTQNKANGLGDLEVLCNLAPIQIGNRVWRDDNSNGIQDPCEPPIPGAVITLYDAAKTTAFVSVTTNANGGYYIASTTLTAGTSTSSVATTALTYNTGYALVLTSLGTSTVVTGLSLTSVSPVTPGESSTANSGSTQANNDAMVMNGKPTIMLSTGGPGSTNHTYDFGISIPDCAKPELAVSQSQTICQGSSFSLPLSTTVTSNTVTGVQWYFTDASGSSFTAISGATSLTFSQQPTSTGGIRYYAIIGQNGLSATCSDTAFVNLMIKPTQTLTISTPSAATVTQCANTTLTVTVLTNALAPDQVRLVYFTSPLATAVSAYTAAGGTVLGTIASTTATGTKTLTFSNLQLPDNVSDDPLPLYVYAVLVSADGACKPADQFTLVLNPRPTVVITANPIVCQGSSTTLAASGPGGTTYQWFAGSGTAVVGTSNTLATGAISTTATYTVRGTYNTCISDNVQIALTPIACTSCTASASTIGGTAFRDYNSNGAQGTNDPGISNVTVTIFSCDASGQSTQVSQEQTDVNGAYSFTGLTPGTTYRVEFSNLPSGYTSTFKGTQNGSTIQFTQPGSCSISVGLNQPNDYCQTDPGFAVVCFTRNNDGATEPTIIDMQYSTGQSFTSTSTADANYTWGQPSGGASYSIAAHNVIATKGDVSTTFGLAWDRTHKQLLSGAFMRAYAPMQANVGGNTFGEATIYKIDYTTGSASTKSVWLDLETVYGDGFAGVYVADATYPGASIYGRTNGTPAKIGYTGLGSMQFARDGHELYTINLKTQELLVIPVNSDGTAVANAAQIKRFPLPTDGCPTGNWSDGRPYQAVLGLGVHPSTNRVYATVTCTGPTADDLKGIVYSVDASDATPASTDFRQELDVPLNLNIPATNVNVAQYYGQNVHPWEVVTANSTFYNNNGDNNSQHTQPWLAEVEFDPQPNGVYGMMIATRNRYHDILNSSFYVTGGVLMRGANLGTEAAPQWSLEHNGAVGPFASGVNYTYTANRAGANTSPTNRFFKYQGLEGTMLAGTMDYIPGRPEILLPALDNVLYNATSGMTWLNRTTGDRSKDNHLLSDGTATGYTNVNFTKSNNWGGLAIMCNVAPIQIGNRVWRDDNKNGLQEPCEPAIPGVVVTLYDAAKTTALASVTTNAAGEYYFSSTTVTAGTSTSSVATTALTYNTSYAVVITSLGSSTVASGLTLTDVSLTPGENGTANSGATLINNDAMVMNGKPTIMLTTNGPGTSNHTYDFGLTVVPCSLSLTATPGTCSTATNQYVVTGTISLTAAPASSLTITDGLVSTIVSVSAGQTSTTYSLSGLNSGTGLHTVTLFSSATACGTTSATYTAPVSCSIAPALAVSVTPGTCSTATNQYAISGTINLTAAVASSLTITDGTSSTVVLVTAGQTTASFNLAGLTSGTGSHTVTVSGIGYSPASTTYTAPASCTVAPCGLAMVVTPGLCQSATNAYTLSGTITATNVPTSGTLTISSGAFSSRTIALPIGNASGTFSYSGLVSNGQTYTVTASYSDGACSPVSRTYTAPVSCSVAPVCSLSATATASSCATAANTYSATVAVALTNGVAGTITINLPGATPVSQTLAANTGSFTAIFENLVSDGATHTATISLPGCSTTTATFTAPASCSVAPICSISAVATAGVCSTATNTYSVTALVTVQNPTAGGTVSVSTGGQTLTFSTTANSQNTFTATFDGLISDGANHTVTASLPGCSTTAATYTAPASCSVAPICSLTATATAGLCATATNTYSSTVVIQLTNPTAGVLTVTDGPQSATLAVTPAGNATFTIEFPGLTSDGTTHTVTASLPGCSTTTTTYTAPASCSVAPVCSISAVVTIGTCATATNTYSATAVVTVTNPTAGGTVSVSTGGQTLTFSTTAVGQNTFTGTFNGLISDGASHTITVSLPGCASVNTPYTAPASCSVAPVCSISAITTTGQCSTATNTYSNTVTVTMTNPSAGTLTVTDGVNSVTIAVPTTLGTVTAPVIFNGLVSNGASHTVTASLPGCSTTTTTYTAPVSCSIAPALAISVTPGTCSTATNQYAITSTINLTAAVAGSLTITDGTSTTTVSIATGQATASFVLNGLASGTGLHTLTVSGIGYAPASTTYTAPASCTVAPVCSLSATATAGICATVTNTYSATVAIALTNSVAGIITISLPGSTPVSQTIVANTSSFSATFTGLVSDGATHIATISLPGCGTTTASFTAPASCSLTPLGSLGDFVWKDNNDNGIQDTNEPGVAGVKLELFTVVGGVRSTSAASTTVTDATGHYSFPNLSEGDYQVRFSEIPVSCTLTPHQNAGTNDAKDSDADPITGFSQVVHIDPSGTGLAVNNPTVDAGLQRLVYDPTGYIYCYKNNTILKGGKISVTGPGSTTVVLDGSKGYYRFLTDGTPGSYTLTYSHPNGYSIATSAWAPAAPSIAPTTLDGSVQDKDIPANGWVQLGSLPTADTTQLQNGTQGYNPYYLVFNVQAGDPYISSNNLPVDCDPLLGSIGDFVWNDLDKDGRQDAGEPGVNGVTIRLLQETTPGNYTVLSTTITAGGGNYLFPNLPEGNYVVEFDKATLPANFSLTTANASGVPTALDSDANTTTGRSGLIALVPTDPTRRDILTIDAGIVDVSCPPAKCLPIVIRRTR
ncbi:SdrD B-like domain-containing protein [Spirosoma foliorum]|uniref:PKD domain-containing protein n=1 Tax=Spirosoma foliorum TaxID=2710596 RepID=A0A7G5GU35_9BACT|nr:SdrD B-like domain-containing protein [Spirosoma foliorum]QMW02377.1 hypothetical protein H3H32_31425 [Spirosoma foliorum]